MRKLATIQSISELLPIEGADRIEIAKLRGMQWRVVVQKGLHNVGDKVVYCEIDSWIPHEIAPFLTKDESKLQEYEGVKGNRLKLIKLKGIVSQGLILPLSALIDKHPTIKEFSIGTCVDQLLNIKLYEPPKDLIMHGEVEGVFPYYIPKTNEERVQSNIELFEMVNGKEVYVTEKLDGTSCTIYRHNNEVGVCSRNMRIRKSENNLYWEIEKKYDILNKLKSLSKNIAIQGEIVGPNIQNNSLKLSQIDFYVFSVFNIDEQNYYTYAELVNICGVLGLKTVPLLSKGVYNWNAVDDVISEFIKNTKSKINNSVVREGVVIRLADSNSKVSFKIITSENI